MTERVDTTKMATFCPLKENENKKMTEKRFTVIDMEEPRGQSVADDGIPCTARHCVTNLNRLYEENIQLKNDNKKLDDEICLLSMELCKTKSYEQLEKDNKRLKQAYSQLKHRHSLLHDECIDAECDRDSYRKDIASLEKENKQLKQRLKEVE